MKYLLLLLLSCLTYGQQPNINFERAGHDTKPYYELLGIEDKDAVIIKIRSGGGWVRMSDSYFVFMPDGKLYSYITFSNLGQTITKKAEVTNEVEKDILRNAAETLNEIDNKLTNHKANAEGQMLDVQDGGLIEIEAYKGDKMISFLSEAPGDFINFKVVGYEMRQKLLDVFEKFEATKYIDAPSIEDVKAWDVVYLYFEEGLLQEKWDERLLPTYHYRIQHITVILYSADDEKTEILRLNKAVKENTIDFDFFMKYGSLGVKALRDKKVFVIDKSEIKNNRVSIHKVKVAYILL